MKDTTIRARWAKEDSERSVVLEKARWCASVSKPWFLPPQGQTENSRLPEPFTSIAALGSTNLVGKMLAALWPPGQAFFELDLKPELRYKMPPDRYQRIKNALFLEELKAMALLESAHIVTKNNGQPRSFRSQKRLALEQCVITGDVLEYLTDDFKIRVFRRDQYTTERDCTGAVCCHIIKETIDPATLTAEQFAAAGIDKAKYDDGAIDEVDSYTLVEHQPRSKTWVVRQEIDGKTYNESEYATNRFFATAYELAPGENYGRGLIELCGGDLRSLNKLIGCSLDFAAAASKINIIKDVSCQIRTDDFARPSGEVIEGGRVVGGVAQDIAYLKTDKMPDFQIVQVSIERLTKALSRALLMEGESAPTGEAGRHSYGWKVVMEELQGITGGVYAAVADEQQIPLVYAVLDQMKTKKLIDAGLVDYINVSTTTGQEAITKRARLANILEATNILAQFAQFNPEIVQRIDPGVFTNMLVRYQSIDEPGLIRSDDQMKALQAQAMKQQAAKELATKAIDTVGNIAQQRAAVAATNAAGNAGTGELQPQAA